MSENSKRSIISRLVSVGISEEEQSFSSVKSIIMLTRSCLISLVVLVFYTIATGLLGFYHHSILCSIAVPLFMMNYYFIYKRKIATAKITFVGLILFVLSSFSILFGKGIGSEFWMIVIGGISLLVFTRRTNAFNLILISLVIIVLIEIAQSFIQPILLIDYDSQAMTYQLNMAFIFGTSFLISFILRFSSDDFEERLATSNRILIKKNKDLTDSIKYAKRIQTAVLPSKNMRENLESNLFVLFEPRDIVSGDFYWMYNLNGKLLFAVVDGTGHGVSGALVSIMAHSLLTQCVEEYGIVDVNQIVEKLKSLIGRRSERWNDDLADFMEITICSYEWETGRLSYASSGNVMYLIKHVNNVLPEDDMLIEGEDRYVMKEIRFPSSFVKRRMSEVTFLTGSHVFRKDDMVYLATNGISSQIGGAQDKKFKSERLKNLLMSVQHQSLKKQQFILNDLLRNWRGKRKRTDDITLLGFKV